MAIWWEEELGLETDYRQPTRKGRERKNCRPVDPGSEQENCWAHIHIIRIPLLGFERLIRERQDSLFSPYSRRRLHPPLPPNMRSNIWSASLLLLQSPAAVLAGVAATAERADWRTKVNV